jgi:hypothetical protein
MPFGLKSWLSEKLARDAPPPARNATALRSTSASRNAAEPYHAVSIRPGEQCCEGAKQFAGIRFLSAKAPKLPLQDCHAAVCRCSYAHFPDRRSGEDRRGLMNWHKPRQADIERRQSRQGRRSTDPIIV